jgi:hypothetical protein
LAPDAPNFPDDSIYCWLQMLQIFQMTPYTVGSIYCWFQILCLLPCHSVFDPNCIKPDYNALHIPGSASFAPPSLGSWHPWLWTLPSTRCVYPTCVIRCVNPTGVIRCVNPTFVLRCVNPTCVIRSVNPLGW